MVLDEYHPYSKLSKQKNSTWSIFLCDECICCLFHSINTFTLPKYSYFIHQMSFKEFVSYEGQAKSNNFHNHFQNSFQHPCPNKKDHNLILRQDLKFMVFLIPTNELHLLLRLQLHRSSNTLVLLMNPTL